PLARVNDAPGVIVEEARETRGVYYFRWCRLDLREEPAIAFNVAPLPGLHLDSPGDASGQCAIRSQARMHALEGGAVFGRRACPRGGGPQSGGRADLYPVRAESEAEGVSGLALEPGGLPQRGAPILPVKTEQGYHSVIEVWSSAGLLPGLQPDRQQEGIDPAA